MGETIEIYPQRGHLLKIGDKFYKIKKEVTGKDGRTTEKEVYEEVNEQEYRTRLLELANKFATFPGIRVQDVILDMLKDMPLLDLARAERLLEKEIKRAEGANEAAKVRTKSGHCTEIEVGKHFVVLRE